MHDMRAAQAKTFDLVCNALCERDTFPPAKRQNMARRGWSVSSDDNLNRAFPAVTKERVIKVDEQPMKVAIGVAPQGKGTLAPILPHHIAQPSRRIGMNQHVWRDRRSVGKKLVADEGDRSRAIPAPRAPLLLENLHRQRIKALDLTARVENNGARHLMSGRK
ncbi:hypothetical protein MesoLjLb_66470 [Mesorhizobium sp. L-8-3]|nr:hypothetical protein MesoLjLb_66470 [Mesorhizobium sp. L-8-3]